MFYRKLLKRKKYNFTLHCGGLGDLIAHLPAIKYCLEFHPHLDIDLWIHDYGFTLCEKVFESYPQCNIKPMSKLKEYKNDQLARSPYAHKISNLSCHLVDHGFYTIAHTSVEDKYKNYIQLDPIDISNFDLPEKYAVVTTGHTTDSRTWKADSINETVEYIISKGITPVFLGKSTTTTGTNHVITGKFEADYSKGINLINKTNLFEAHGIMAKAKFVIGLDNGLCPHLAAMSDVPIIVGFTSVEPRHRLPYRKNQLGWNCYVVKPKNLDCFGCQSNHNFADTTHDFKYCFYKDYKCVEMLTSELWIEQINKVLAPKTSEEKAEKAYQEILQNQELNKKIKEMGISINE